SQEHLGRMDAGERKASIGIDWLQGTVPFEKMPLLTSYLNALCDTQAEFYNFGMMSFQACCQWHPFGIKMAWDLDEKNRKRHKDRILLVLEGSTFRDFTPINLFRFVKDMALKFSFKCSRIDLAFDDFEKIIEPREVLSYADQGFYKGFRFHDPHGRRMRNGELKGDGVTFGARGGGGKYLRCYNKELESKGETDSIRWEVEFSKDRANAIFIELVNCFDLDEFACKISMFIGGSIDFAERMPCGKFNELDRLAFWEQILHYLGKAVIRCP
ncbi:replication initiation factor domain-containing protein, partial [Pontiellaceae bacterium B12219]|nr:replication initiation factor domain-containing protein [Pontiellaceae bacterium B12219]MDF7809652.1 replication initiation factor domain-containing protein [Pontiellaceae bacterium B12219]